MLEIQHRMQPEIAAYPSVTFYGSALYTAVGRLAEPRSFPYASRPAPIVFINVDDPEKKRGSSFRNRGVNEVLVEGIKNMMSAGDVRPSEIAIISPYVSQVELAKERLRAAGIRIGTCVSVDGAQGQEYPIVCLSLVRCNPDGKFGFLSDYRRLNVAMTRARRGLMIVGSQRTLLTRDQNKVWYPFSDTSPQKIG